MNRRTKEMKMKTRKVTKKDRRIRMFEGLPVVDAAQNVDITITAADVRNSKKKNPGACAAAVATERKFHRPVKVFLSRMYVKDKNQWVRFITPGNIAREIISFDRGSEFEPGEYHFRAPTVGQRLGSHGSSQSKGTHKTRKPQHVVGNVRISAKGSYQNVKK
jgi:hypothetical protein